jgi:two-component sensor histidine kinase/DNA-binding transcriptional MerR regulator
MKNMFAMVQAIANQSLRGMPDPGIVENFQQRLVALSTAHDVLLQDSWAPAPIGRIVAQPLTALTIRERVDVQGPTVVFGQRATLACSMFLHELATNALKYGALSVPEGRVELDWRIVAQDAGKALVMTWRETGRPKAVAPSRKGFGSRLIQRVARGGRRRDALSRYRVRGRIYRFAGPFAAGLSQGVCLLVRFQARQKLLLFRMQEENRGLLPNMRMRELERQSGVGRETIRFYIREGLLPEPDRASRNSAFYSDDHVTRLRAIKRLQEERFLPLAVIRSLLDAEDGERWLVPSAFPMLDSLLAARLGADAARVPVAELLEGLSINSDTIAEHCVMGTISVDAEGMVSARDAAIVRLIAELDAIGFSEELGFTGGMMRIYLDFIDWVTNQEMRVFFESTSGNVGESRALDMAERGVSVVNELLTQLRTRAILKKLGERRKIANDNS